MHYVQYANYWVIGVADLAIKQLMVCKRKIILGGHKGHGSTSKQRSETSKHIGQLVTNLVHENCVTSLSFIFTFFGNHDWYLASVRTTEYNAHQIKISRKLMGHE